MNKSTLVGVEPHGGTTDKGMELRIIPIDSIIIPQHHPRTDQGNIEELQGSLRRDGMQEPLLVYSIGEDKYAVIDGARRLIASKGMGMEHISCLVHGELSEADAVHLSYVKNVERKTLNPIEIALHIKTMKDDFGYTLDELELKGYGSRSAIADKLKLLDLSKKVQRLIQGGAITPGHAKAIVKLPTIEEQDRMAKRIVDFDLTVRVTDDRVSRYLAKKRKAKKSRTKEIIPSDHVPGVYFKDSRNMSELPDKYVHLIVSSPNYHVGMEFEKGLTFKEHLAETRDGMGECARVLVPGGSMALNVADIVNFRGNTGTNDKPQWQFMGHRYQSYLRKYGVILTDVIIWEKRPAWTKDRHPKFKETTTHTSYRFFDNWEPIYIFRKKGEREIPSEDIVQKSMLTREQWIAYVPGVWKIEPTRNLQGHPCMYPDELVKRLVQMFSYVGDTVLDPYLGSGTTVKVARELGREGIGYERELKYKPVIMKKLGIEPEATEGTPSETMADYAERSLDSDAPTDETTTEKESYFYSRESEKEAVEAEMAT